VSRRKKVHSWNSVEPKTLQEQRAEDRETPVRPHGGSGRYKDKRNWCRGKIGGRRHTGVVVLDRWSWKPDDVPSCYYTFNYRYSNAGRTLHSRRIRYSCNHKIVCSNQLCKKVLDWRLDESRCPVSEKVFFDLRTRVTRPAVEVFAELESESEK